jgi:hypothetical protein
MFHTRDKHRTEKKLWRLVGLTLVTAFIVSLFTVALVDTRHASADPAPVAPTPTNQKTAASSGSSCAIDKIGWILCPVMEKVAWISDNAFKVLADNFLETDPQLVSDKIGGADNGTKIAWNIALNIANIMFVIAFLVIILSQVTGYGISNYGIKRMIPRLVVAAILVNASYYICQLAVDLSNILGYGIQDALKSIANQIGPSVFGDASNYDSTAKANGVAGTLSTATGTSNGIITIIVTAALASAALVWISLPSILSIVPLILITVVTIIIILMMRKAIIVLLVVMSPLAFVMYLLPNTEKFFTKWRTMFVQLLMVFPIVALLFGAGQLASTIILVAGASDSHCVPTSTATNASTSSSTAAPTQTGCLISVGGGSSKGSAVQATWTTGLIATAVAVAPLLAVWGVLKGALSAAGAIGGKISGSIEKGAGIGGKFVGGKLDDAYKHSALGVGKELRDHEKNAFKRKRALNSLNPGKNAAGEDIRTLRSLAGGGIPGLLKDTSLGKIGTIHAQNEAITRAASVRQQIDDEETKAAYTSIENHADGKLMGAQKEMQHAIVSKDMTTAKAAIQALMTTGEKGVDALEKQLDEVMKHMGEEGGKKFADGIREYIMQAHPDMKGKSSAIEMWANNYTSKDETRRDRSVSGWAAQAETFTRLNDAQFSSQTRTSMESAGSKLALAAKSLNAAGELETRGARLLGNPESSRNLDDGKRGVINAALTGK